MLNTHAFAAFEPLEPRLALSASSAALPPSLEPNLPDTGDVPSTGFPYVAYMPEGFASATINEFVPITNPNPTPVSYELWARYERGSRDQLIDAATIPANTRGGVTISDSAHGGALLVRGGEPYALVLKATARLAGSFSHYDFGGTIGEMFTDQTATTWSFADVTIDHTRAAFQTFILEFNPLPTDVSATLTIYRNGAAPIAFTSTVPAMRRSGWALNDLLLPNDAPLPDGQVSVMITATAPIVASLSHYQPDQFRGFGTLGVPDGGSTAGVISKIQYENNFYDRNGDEVPQGIPRFPADATASILNSGTTPARVVLSFFNTRVQSITKQIVQVVAAQSTLTIHLRDLNLLAGEYALAYVADAPVTVLGAVLQGLGAVGTVAESVAASQWDFGEGYMSASRGGGAVLESLWVFNPQNIWTTVHSTFYFADGAASITIDSTVPPQSQIEVEIDQVSAIRMRRPDQWYGIRVAAASPIIAMLEHWDSGNKGGFGTFGSPSGTTAALSGLLIRDIYDPPTALFSDEFNSGGRVSETSWTTPFWTPTDNPAYFGRTGVRDWRAASGSQLNISGDGYVSLPLDTYNPADQSHNSFYGTEIDTAQRFTVGTGMGIEARVWIDPTMPPGAVASLFTYDINASHTSHSEIDTELLSNFFRTTPRVNTNIYNNEPLGAGHPSSVPIPGVTLLGGWNRIRMNWYPTSSTALGRIVWLVNDIEVLSRNDVLPQSQMGVRLNVWAPGAEWGEAYSSGLTPASNPGHNARYEYRVDYVRVFRL